MSKARPEQAPAAGADRVIAQVENAQPGQSSLAEGLSGLFAGQADLVVPQVDPLQPVGPGRGDEAGESAVTDRVAREVQVGQPVQGAGAGQCGRPDGVNAFAEARPGRGPEP